MYAKDHPEEVKYNSADTGTSASRLIQWADGLEGTEREKYEKRPHDFISKKIADTLEHIRRAVAGKQKNNR
jgi:hypothetical protein